MTTARHIIECHDQLRYELARIVVLGAPRDCIIKDSDTKVRLTLRIAWHLHGAFSSSERTRNFWVGTASLA